MTHFCSLLIYDCKFLLLGLRSNRKKESNHFNLLHRDKTMRIGSLWNIVDSTWKSFLKNYFVLIRHLKVSFYANALFPFNCSIFTHKKREKTRARFEKYVQKHCDWKLCLFIVDAHKVDSRTSYENMVFCLQNKNNTLLFTP